MRPKAKWCAIALWAVVFVSAGIAVFEIVWREKSLGHSSRSQAQDLPVCATAAAQEFSIPVKLFTSMALAEGWDQCGPECKKKAEARLHFGPMGLHPASFPDMAIGLGVPIASIKEDACTNYRAAAWWYVNKAGGNQSDMWAAVTRYYYGRPDRANPHATHRAQKIYEEL